MATGMTWGSIMKGGVYARQFCYYCTAIGVVIQVVESTGKKLVAKFVMQTQTA